MTNNLTGWPAGLFEQPRDFMLTGKPTLEYRHTVFVGTPLMVQQQGLATGRVVIVKTPKQTPWFTNRRRKIEIK